MRGHLQSQDLTLAYGSRLVARQLALEVSPGEIVSLVGPNGSGKSTILRALGRLLVPRGGHVLLDGKDIYRLRPREVARRIGVLTQGRFLEDELTVRELVMFGRTPYQGLWGRAGAEDQQVVEWALARTDLRSLAGRPVTSLSGGEQQRAWIAMALAQKPQVLLLDEPTTFLDLGHQLEVLELVRALNQSERLTVVMVLQDLNQASRYSHRLLVVYGGAVVASGPPQAVLTVDLVRQVFRVEAALVREQHTGAVLCVPYAMVNER